MFNYQAQSGILLITITFNVPPNLPEKYQKTKIKISYLFNEVLRIYEKINYFSLIRVNETVIW